MVLEDGIIFEGSGFGVKGESFGEVVFNTSMSGYQEINSLIEAVENVSLPVIIRPTFTLDGGSEKHQSQQDR